MRIIFSALNVQAVRT